MATPAGRKGTFSAASAERRKIITAIHTSEAAMIDEHDLPDEADEEQRSPKRPPENRRLRASRLAPQPGGFGLESKSAPRHDTRAPASEIRQPYVPMQQGAELRAEQAAEPAEAHSWKPHVESQIKLWKQAQFRFAAALEQAASLNAPASLLEACADGRSVAASGLVLALAVDICLADPSPQNRKALIDMRRNILTFDDALSAFLALPSDRLTAKVLNYLDAYRDEFAAPFLDVLPTIERALDVQGQGRGEGDEGLVPKGDVQPSVDLRDREEGTGERVGPADEPEPEDDWRAAAYAAARYLLDQAQSAERAVEQEMPVSEQDHIEATREQTDARRDRLAGEFQRAAREVAASVMRPTGRERDDEGGRELS
jgi:hypothetical protein